MIRPLRRLLVAGLALLSLAGAVSSVPALAAQPCQADCLRVYSIKLYTYLGPDVEAHVQVTTDAGGIARGAVVEGTWTLPDASTVVRYGIIGTRGRAEFPLNTDQSGTAVFTVTDIRLSGYTFDPAGSNVLSASYELNNPPPPASCTVNCAIVTDIAMRVRKGDVRAKVSVDDETGAAIRRASVALTWTLPDGTQVSQTARTNRKGTARFTVDGSVGGTYTVNVTGITATRFTYDPDSSVTMATLTR